MSLSPLQKRIASTVDAIIVPGGEDSSRLRSQHALELLLGVQQEYRHQPIIVATGKAKASYNYQQFESEAQATLHYIKLLHFSLQNPLSESLLLAEEDSLDTFGNFYFSKKLLDQKLSGFVRKSIGVVTNPYHMDRALWCAKQFFKGYEIEPLETPKLFSYAKKHLKENIGLNIFKLALRYQDPEQFLQERHPLYAPLETSSPVLKKLFKERIELYRNNE